MVIVHIANAGTRRSREFEARADRAVDVEAPFLDVAIPAGRHLGGQHELAFGFEDRNAGEVSGVASRAGRLGSRIRAPESGDDIRSVALKAMLVILPVAIRAAGVPIVL